MANNLITTLKDNKNVIVKKALIFGGATLGVIVAGALMKTITRSDRDVLVVEEV